MSVSKFLKRCSMEDVKTNSFPQGVPHKLIEIYGRCGIDKCLSVGKWRFYAFSEIPMYNNFGAKSLWQFAEMYEGLGWSVSACVDLENGKILLKHCGGSNGNIAESNILKTLEYRSKAADYAHTLLSIEDFMQICIVSDKHDMCPAELAW